MSKKMIKIALVTFLSLAFIVSFSVYGCAPAEEPVVEDPVVEDPVVDEPVDEPVEEPVDEEPVEAPEDITIGFTVWTMEFTFFQRVERGVRDAAEEFGYEYIMMDQTSDATKMIEDINTLVGMGVDAIVITPVDPGAIGPAVQNARDAGIPVVCADIGFSGPVNALIISDNYMGGQLAAEYLDEQLQDDATMRFGLGNLSPEWTYARQRGEGFKDAAEELGYEIASELIVDPPDAEGGFDTMQQIMSAAPDISGAFFASGREAVGAARAVEAAGEDILVVGYNGDPEELLAIQDGILAGTILQLPYQIGYQSVEIVREILEEGATYEQEEIGAPVELVTPENLDEIADMIEETTGISAFE